MPVTTPVLLSNDLLTDPRYNPNGKTSPGIVVVGSNLYIALDQTTHGFDIFKSTDGGETWIWKDEAGANARASGEAVYYGESCCYGGGKFHFIWFNDYTDTLWYHAFNTATDLWETSINLGLSAVQSDATNISVKSVYRSDGTIVFTYQPDWGYIPNLGVLTAGVVTSSGIVIDASIIMIDQLLVDSSDRVHILFTPGLWGSAPHQYLYHKSWASGAFSPTTTAIDNHSNLGYGDGIYNRVGKATIYNSKIIIPYAKHTSYWSNSYTPPYFTAYTETFPSNHVMAIAYSDALVSPTWTSVEVTNNLDGTEKRPDVVPAYAHWYASAVIYCESQYQVVWSSEYLFHSYYAGSSPSLPRFYNKLYRVTSPDLINWGDPQELLTSTYFTDTTYAAESPHTWTSAYHYPVNSPLLTDASALSLGMLVAYNGPLVSGTVTWPGGGPFGFSAGSLIGVKDASDFDIRDTLNLSDSIALQLNWFIPVADTLTLSDAVATKLTIGTLVIVTHNGECPEIIVNSIYCTSWKEWKSNTLQEVSGCDNKAYQSDNATVEC